MEQIVENAGCPRRSPTAGLFQRLMVLAALLLSGCVSTGGYIKGQVLDADTREPIPDAHVAITWAGGAFVFVQTDCIRADATLTDPDGKFRFLPWARWDGVLPKTDVHYSNIIIYKSGYFDMQFYDLLQSKKGKNAPERNGELYLLKRFEGGDLSREEYMDYLLQVNEWASCGEDHANLMPMLRALYAESERFAQTNSEKEKANIIRLGLEYYELRSDEAAKRRRE